MADIDLSGLTPRTEDAADSDVVMKEGAPDTMGLVNARLLVKFANTTPPAAPATDQLSIFRNAIAKAPFLGTIGPSNEPRPMQRLLVRCGVGLWLPAGNSATAPSMPGEQGMTTTGFTLTARNVATTNYFTRRKRLGLVTAATAAAVGQFRISSSKYTIGDGAGVGGFIMMMRFGISDAAAVSGARMAMGMGVGATALTNVEPSTLTQCIFMGHGAADTNFKIFYGGSAAQTPIDLGASFPCNTLSTDMYELTLFAPPNAQVIHYEVTRLNTGAVATGTISGTVGTQIPNSTQLLNINGMRTNNATALACGLDVSGVYLETCDE